MPALTADGRAARARVLAMLGRLVKDVPDGVVEDFDWDACSRRTPEDAMTTHISSAEFEALWAEHREDMRANGLSAEFDEVARWQAELDRRTEAAMVPPRYRDSPLDVTHADELAEGRWVYVHGVMGSGKTFLASAILRGWLSRNEGKALFVPSTQLIAEINATYSNTDSVLEVLDRYGRVPLLVIDDLGKEVPTENTLSMLWHVLNARYSWWLPTVVTSQYSIGRLGARLSEKGNGETAGAVVSRIRESMVDVDMGTMDLRLGA